MNKCTLLIDGNWLLMSRFFAIGKGFNIDNETWEKEKSQEELEELLVRSINVILNRFYGTIDNIILVADGGSWRKQLPKPYAMEESYKGNREQTEELDWEYIYGALNNVYKRFDELGITCCKDLHIEGDDWCWYWSRRLNSEGINCIIWSSDNDLKQLVQVDNFAFTAWYNDRNGMFFHESLREKPIDEIDFFMTQETENELIKQLKQQVIQNVSYVDPYNIIASKIICGDAGDNIKSLIRVKKGTRTYKVSEKEWETCRSQLNLNTLDEFLENKETIVATLLGNTKYKGQPVDNEAILEMFDYNTKLVWLNEQVIPETIIHSMNEYDYKEYDLSYIRNNFKVLLKRDNIIENIFEGI